MEDHAKVLAALQEVGINVEDLWELVNFGGSTGKAIPVLARMLGVVEDASVKEAIVRSLSVREARGVATSALLTAMRSAKDDEMLGWAIANALSIVISPEDNAFDEIAQFLRDEEFGIARQMLCEALVRTEDQRTLEVLREVIDHEGLTGHVIFALGQLGDPSSGPLIRSYLLHSSTWVRKEAKRALAKIEKRKRAPTRSGRN